MDMESSLTATISKFTAAIVTRTRAPKTLGPRCVRSTIKITKEQAK
jgi:hypothetical protein